MLCGARFHHGFCCVRFRVAAVGAVLLRFSVLEYFSVKYECNDAHRQQSQPDDPNPNTAESMVKKERTVPWFLKLIQ
jgi:hypothetical protein